MAKRSDDRKKFLLGVFNTAIEGGINYWATIDDYHWTNATGDQNVFDHEDLDGFFATVYELAEGNTEDVETIELEDRLGYPYLVKAKPHRINIDVVARGVRLFTDMVKGKDGGEKLPYSDYWWQFVEANDTNGVKGDYDAIVADQIVQFGLFGKTIYG